MVTKMDHQNCVEITMCAHNKYTSTGLHSSNSSTSIITALSFLSNIPQHIELLTY